MSDIQGRINRVYAVLRAKNKMPDHFYLTPTEYKEFENSLQGIQRMVTDINDKHPKPNLLYMGMAVMPSETEHSFLSMVRFELEGNVYKSFLEA